MSEPSRDGLPPRAGQRHWSSRALDSRRFWAIAVALLAFVPVAAGFLPNRVFHVRDLSLFFWPRHLWFRRALLSGEWPLWDPYAAAGQSAVADALNQMFLLPALVLRLLGSERIGFNLWIAAPFPIAALGMYRYLLRRFSARAAAVGALAFAVSGPVVSTGNFPNLSWSAAAMPWVLWATDRCMAAGGGRRAVAWLALAFGLQAVSGEPVTLVATGVLALAHALILPAPGEEGVGWKRRLGKAAAAAAGLGIGGALAAIQLLPLAQAVTTSWRSAGPVADFWSLHPLGLAETVSVHLFGDYFSSPNLLALPWMTPLNSGRDPFFFSIYIGPTLLAMALFGAVSGWSRRWSAFWIGACLVSVLAASGAHTPFYPFLQAHLPFVGSFRFPVKFLLVAIFAIASLAAGAWQAISQEQRRLDAPRRYRYARIAAVAVPLLLALLGYGLCAAVLYFPVLAARGFFEAARFINMADPIQGAAYLLGSLPSVAARLVLLSLAAALLIGVASSRRREARLGRVVLFLLLTTDLLAAAWGINPTADASILAEPAWVSTVKAHQETRFYFGGRKDGTLDPADPDGPQAYTQYYGKAPATIRSAINNQAVFFPAGRGIREIFSYDLAVLWPRPFQTVHQRFLAAGAEDRERFLDRLAVRFRVLRASAAGSRRPLVALPCCEDTALYDYGTTATRVAMLSKWGAESDLKAEIDLLFDARVNPAQVVILTAPPPPLAGVAGRPATPGARIVEESNDRVVVDASAAAGGGILRLLDSYSPDWEVSVDGSPAPLLRADVLFRAVGLTAGRHRVEFRYRPRAFYYGAAISLAALIGCTVLWRWPAGKDRHATAHTYHEVFYQYIERGAKASAARIVPILVRHLAPSSVLDVGCGAGAWLSEYRRAGIEDVVGIDGDYVRRERLLIPPDRFRVHDLSTPFDLGKRFDLVQCLEVAEHLPPSSSRGLVASLVSHGDRVLFSAAVPGQGGEHHVNEQPLEYWRGLFAEQGFLAFDPIRPAVADCGDVEPWYRFNTLLYVRASGVDALPTTLSAAAAGDRPSLSTSMPLGYRIRISIVRRLPTPIVTWLATWRARWIVTTGQAHRNS